MPIVPPAPFHSLHCHPAARCPAVDGLAVGLSVLADGALALAYRLHGRLDRLRLPAPGAGGLADGLWRHTCFELFVGRRGEPAYREFNFSPAGQWAAYAFADYRQREAFALPAGAPEISLRRVDDRLAIDVRLAAAFLPPASADGLQLGLSAVVETRDGELSYWALAHPAAHPDFHRRAAFTLNLAAPFPKAPHDSQR